MCRQHFEYSSDTTTCRNTRKTESSMRSKSKNERHPRKHRFRLCWLGEIAWPNDARNFKRNVASAKRVEIAKRLLAYLMFPPPALARPGGRVSVQGSAAEESSATERKKANLEKGRQRTHDQLQTYLAFELAHELAAYETASDHRRKDLQKYNEVYLDFRVISGFSRILTAGGNHVGRPTIQSGVWMQMMGAFCVFALFARLGELRSRFLSERICQKVVLLRQKELGLRISHATLSKACIRYRSVAHLLVGLFGAMSMCGKRHGDDWIKTNLKNPPTLDLLTSMLGEHLREGVVRSHHLEMMFCRNKIKKRGGPLVRREYQVKLPKDLQVGRLKGSATLLCREELDLVAAMHAE
jgi:hypothetical protein